MHELFELVLVDHEQDSERVHHPEDAASDLVDVGEYAKGRRLDDESGTSKHEDVEHDEQEEQRQRAPSCSLQREYEFGAPRSRMVGPTPNWQSTHSLSQYVRGETGMVPILNDLITHKIWDTAKCKAESLDTVKSLSQREDTKELYDRLSICYQNISWNVNLLESQSKINNQEKIPLTLHSMIYEFYFHGLVGYLRSASVGYVWDQLFLHDDWRRLKEITIQILVHSNLVNKMVENKVEDAVNLYRVVRAHLKTLRVIDLKQCILTDM